MTETTDRYQNLPFSSKPSPERHIDRMALLASLTGLCPEPPKSPRVLELGCSTGDAMLGMACSVPEGQFLGIDISESQVRTAQAAREYTQLSNVEFRQLDLRSLPLELGTFDYIICHGLFTWVPADVRSGILSACEKLLTPRGVASISFNAAPGWDIRGKIASHLQQVFLSRPDCSPDLNEIREYLRLLREVQVDDYSPYGQLLRSELEQLSQQSDALLQHELLNKSSTAFTPAEFSSLLRPFGLEVFAEARRNEALFVRPDQLGLPRELRNLYERNIADNSLQQDFWNFLFPRPLRTALVARTGSTFNLSDRSIFERCYFSAPILDGPETDRSVAGAAGHRRAHPLDDLSAKTVLVEFARGESLEVREPLLRAALRVLRLAWPVPISLAELNHEIAESLQANEPRGFRFWPFGRGSSSSAEGLQLEKLAEVLFPLWIRNQVECTVYAPRMERAPSEKPAAHPLARWQASQFSAAQSWVSNYRHEYTQLTQFERALLPKLDGTRTRAELTEIVRQQLATNYSDSPPPKAKQEISPQEAESALEAALLSFRSSALLADQSAGD